MTIASVDSITPGNVYVVVNSENFSGNAHCILKRKEDIAHPSNFIENSLGHLHKDEEFLILDVVMEALAAPMIQIFVTGRDHPVIGWINPSTPFVLKNWDRVL